MVLKPAADNQKLSGRHNGTWTKGPFKGQPLYSLTLEERATCQHDCPAWDVCYGNNMPFTSRFDVTQDDGAELMTVLEMELTLLDYRHRATGYTVRLHVLGDFFSTRYVQFWADALECHPQLSVYGYTHRTGEIGHKIDEVFIHFPGRFVIMQSDPDERDSGIRPAASMDPLSDLVLCPKQTDRVDSCLACGLCANPNIRGVRFKVH